LRLRAVDDAPRSEDELEAVKAIIARAYEWTLNARNAIDAPAAIYSRIVVS